MDWYVDALFGLNGRMREEALARLSPDLVNLLAEKGLTSVSVAREGRLPEELMEYVRKYFDEEKHSLPMSSEEADEHRRKLMQERSAFVKTAEDGWQDQTYSFCEH
jgi:hypothetical protein